MCIYNGKQLTRDRFSGLQNYLVPASLLSHAASDSAMEAQ